MFKNYIYIIVAILLLVIVFSLFSKKNGYEYFTNRVSMVLNTPLTINTGKGGQEKETELEKKWDQHIHQYWQVYNDIFGRCGFYSKNKALFSALFAKGAAQMKIMVPQQHVQNPQVLKRVCEIMSVYRQ